LSSGVWLPCRPSRIRQACAPAEFAVYNNNNNNNNDNDDDDDDAGNNNNDDNNNNNDNSSNNDNDDLQVIVLARYPLGGRHILKHERHHRKARCHTAYNVIYILRTYADSTAFRHHGVMHCDIGQYKTMHYNPMHYGTKRCNTM